MRDRDEPANHREFVCSQCGAGYQARQKPSAEEMTGSYSCEVCQTEIYAWSGPYAYLDWQAVETLPKPNRETPPSGRFD
jgi:hypothetical protein